MAKQSEIRKQNAELKKQLAERESDLADTLAQLAATGGATPAAAKKAAKAPASRLAQSQVEDVPGAGDSQESGQS
jgi:hypothetical protein